jgi:hypothetical protein
MNDAYLDTQVKFPNGDEGVILFFGGFVSVNGLAVSRFLVPFE